MFEMENILPPPIMKNLEYHEAAWDTRDVPNKEDIIGKLINDGLYSAMQEEVEENDNIYQTITPKE